MHHYYGKNMNKPTLLIAIFLISVACKKPRPEIGVEMSYYRTDYYSLHYLRCTVTNHTDEKLYLPHFRSFISVFEDDIDVTAIFNENYLYFGNDYDNSLVRMAIDTLAASGYRSIPDIVYHEEEKTFLGLNNIDTLKITPEIKAAYSSLLDYFCLTKYDGLLIDAHETIILYKPIYVLFDENSGYPKSNYTIRFRREDNFLYSMHDTVKVSGYKFYTPLVKSIDGYRIYDKPIECYDVITLNPTSVPLKLGRY